MGIEYVWSNGQPIVLVSYHWIEQELTILMIFHSTSYLWLQILLLISICCLFLFSFLSLHSSSILSFYFFIFLIVHLVCFAFFIVFKEGPYYLAIMVFLLGDLLGDFLEDLAIIGYPHSLTDLKHVLAKHRLLYLTFQL